MNDGFGFWDGFFLLLIFVPMAAVWFRTIVDIFDRVDIGGFSKALWLVCVAVLPLFGTFIYLVARPVTDQDLKRAAAVERGMIDLRAEQRMAAGFSVADELTKLQQLRDNSSISQAEFDDQRGRLLNYA